MKTLLNGLAIVMLAWIAYVLYGFFTHSGLWRLLENAFADSSGYYDPAAVFSVAALLGAVPLGAVGWLVWRLRFARRRSVSGS